MQRCLKTFDDKNTAQCYNDAKEYVSIPYSLPLLINIVNVL